MDTIKAKPGEILRYDYRVNKDEASGINKNIGFKGYALKVMQWNIERGYKLDQIIEEIKQFDPDIAMIQEVDIGCKRSLQIDQMEHICKELNWLGGFVTEFLELESDIRCNRDQGGGIHGNAIFSKFDMMFDKIEHKYQPVNWESEGSSLKEPRLGKRYTLIAEVITPCSPVLCYSAHLEVFCGLSHRVLQFSEILEHSQKNLDEFPYQLVFGDMNTMGHSIARLSSKFCKDSFRWRSIGLSESLWWYENIMSFHISEGPFNLKLLNSHPELNNHPNVLKNARNPGLLDPWHPDLDITLDNPDYYGFYKAKLDWTFFRGFGILSMFKSNLNYLASDHLSLNLILYFKNDLSQFENLAKFKKKHSFFRFHRFLPSVNLISSMAVSFAVIALLAIRSYRN
ncbi:hypothetical protein K502DRAFT_350236 [Neoconidiobolus thromboides FSU 785]|nr:hypothetical protein K502DRAFT_350236 [Neoconidiobolus thromboides FSU 785]